MPTTKQKATARRNIQKAQRARQTMSARGHARAQPEGRSRAKPGASGGGGFFHIEVRPRRAFKAFRTQDVGKKGGIERVAGKRGSGAWDTQKWLISKDHAHRVGARLVPDTADARHVLATLGASPTHIRGDRYQAKPRPNVPEREKPTTAQRRARKSNIKKAQTAKRRGSAVAR
jgi:hypothetical protein